MTATFELAAWFTVVGLILGAALASWWYESALVKAERQYRKRTAEAVAAVRREAGESGYRHGYNAGVAEGLTIAAAGQGQERRLFVVPDKGAGA